jgi:hypothetical protein
MANLMRFFGWYVAAVLAAHALSTSWSLGQASARMIEIEEQAAQLSFELDVARARLSVVDSRAGCTGANDDCPQDGPTR